MTPKTPPTTSGPAAPRSGPEVTPGPACPRSQSPGTSRLAPRDLDAAAQDGGRLPAQHPDVPPAAPGVPPCPRDEAGAEGVSGRSAGRAPGPSVGESEPADGPGVKGLQALAAAMSEDELERGMRRILKDLGLRLAYHPWKLHAKRAREGFPDWTITGPGGLIFRELKTEAGKVTPAQQEWLDALAAAGADAGVWRPLHLLDGTIARELADLAGYGGTR